MEYDDYGEKFTTCPVLHGEGYDGKEWAALQMHDLDAQTTNWMLVREKKQDWQRDREKEDKEKDKAWIKGLNDNITICPIAPQMIQFSYPWVMYAGFNPQANELIIANLADQELPQQMIILPEPCKFVSFIEKPIQEEQAQFCLLIEEGRDSESATYRQLIISKQSPFKKIVWDSNGEISVQS